MPMATENPVPSIDPGIAPELAELSEADAPALEQDAGGGAIARRLPFAFARRHGILVLDSDAEQADTVFRPGIEPASLAEVRRYMGMRLALRPVPEEEFDALLQGAYEGGSGSAMQMVEGLEDGDDLLRVAQELPDPTCWRATTTRQSSA